MKRKTIEHYEIVRRLGAGGSGVVYLANDTLLQRPVVLKILRAGVMSAEQLRSTVLREARLASAIEHPNVCAYLRGWGEPRRRLYRHAVRAWPVARSPDCARSCESSVGAVGGHPGGGWIAGRARAGHLPPRSEAAERDAYRRGAGEDPGLWTGAAAASGRCKLRPVEACAGQGCVRGGDLHGAGRNDPLHGAGAIRDRAVERAVGRMGAGRDSL